MDKIAIVLDTNVFGKPEYYSFDKGIINNLLNSLSEFDNIEIYIPSIVLEELKKHIRECIEIDKKNIHFKYVKKTINFEAIEKEVIKKLEDFITKNKIKILHCEEYLNILDINKWYFNCEKPFEKKKPKEFPDAMVVSAVVNFFRKNRDYKIFMISDDNGFAEAIKRENMDINVFKKLEDVTSKILGYSDKEIQKLNEFIYKNNILYDTNLFDIESAELSDIIDIEIENVEQNYIEILNDDENATLVKVKYDISVKGNIFVLDPYESIYDREDSKYIYPIYKTTNKLKFENIDVYLEFLKEKNGNYHFCNVIDKTTIDITKYLNYMECYFEE